MSIGIKLGSIIDELGSPDFFNSFFSTIVGLLENNVRGSRYPIISLEFYKGHIPIEKLEQAVIELKSIQHELSKFPPNAVIWDIEDLSLNPPWEDNISKEITSMANYFVSSGGRDLFALIFEVFSYAIETKRPVHIVEI